MTKWKYSRVKSIRLLRETGNFFDTEIEQICEIFLAKAPTKQGKKECICPCHKGNTDKCFCYCNTTLKSEPKKVKEIALPELPEKIAFQERMDASGLISTNATYERFAINQLRDWAEAVTNYLKNK